MNGELIMKRDAYTRAGLALSLAAAIGLGYIAYLQYQLAKVNEVIATTIAGAQKAAKAAKKLHDEGKSDMEISDVAELEGKGWELTDNNQTYEYKEEGRVYAQMYFDPKTGKVTYKIDCGSFDLDSAKEECSSILDGTGRNYIATDNVPW